MRLLVKNVRVLKSNIPNKKDKVVFTLNIDLGEKIEVTDKEGNLKEIDRTINMFNWEYMAGLNKDDEPYEFIKPCENYSKAKQEYFPYYTMTLTDTEKKAICDTVRKQITPSCDEIVL